MEYCIALYLVRSIKVLSGELTSGRMIGLDNHTFWIYHRQNSNHNLCWEQDMLALIIVDLLFLEVQ